MWTIALAFADPTPPAVRELIQDQLEAFETHDAERAWKHVSPGLRATFRTADGFLQMVERGYAPVVAPRSVRFGDFTTYDGDPAQWLDLEGRDGGRYRALYLLEAQADGSWRTSGCMLFEVAPTPPAV
ncbi:MAG: DUF4864 domain-containing protein [Alphaproteobacteria bacterium]|nr:DUF4864 domain-containing protein [Alphaproteobacteria bacterium]MCB9694827.1 DUF4864 domain-containing protein [Alphaproteobacteria bacterium]